MYISYKKVGIFCMVLAVSLLSFVSITMAAEPAAMEESNVAESTEQAANEEIASTGVAGPGVQSQPSLTQGIAVDPAPIQNLIEDIEIRGNQIISSGTILNKIKSRRGATLRQGVINDDIKRLYASGFFQDIKVDVVEGDPGKFRVIFTVDEKPIVRQIIIEGNESVQETKVRKEIKVIEGQILDPKVVKESVVAIRTLYGNKGFKFIEVKSEVDVNENTKEAILYILIDEGQKYKIGRVQFEGNSAFSSRKLRGLMRTKARSVFLLRFGVFHDDHFQNDLEKINGAYQRAGFADIRVEPSFDYDRDLKEMIITIKVDEGLVYYAGDVRIQGNVLYPESEIWEVLSMLPGDVYSQINLNDDISAIQRFYFYQGYIAAQINPEVQFNKETGKVDILYTIFEGDLFFINKVKIRGNTKTKDMVIRRELRIRPGEKFDGQAVDNSKERLESLGYFEEVIFETEEVENATAPNVRDIIFKVKERQTGQLSFGGGVSSIETLIGFAEVSQSNFDLMNWPTFTGGGQNVSFRARLGTRTRDVDFSFTEPYVFNKPYSYTLRLYNTFEEAENIQWDEKRTGTSMTVGHSFTDTFSASTGFTLEQVKIEDVEDGASDQILENGDKNNLLKGRFTVAHDTRNNRLNPTRGHLASITPEIVVGDSEYYSLFFSFSKYWTFFRTHVLESRTRVGGMETTGSTKSVPVFDRYFAGGIGTVRGYGFRRVSPFDPEGDEGDPVGGQSLIIQNIEYSFPIIDNFKGIIFMDIAQVNADGFDFF